jgi:hypothetical protein
MKKLLLSFLLIGAGMGACTVQAHEGFRGFHDRCCYRGGGMGWVAPMAIGGIIGYELSRPQVYVQPPVVVQPPVYISQQPYYQAPPVGYHWQEMIDPQTNTTKIVLVPN